MTHKRSKSMVGASFALVLLSGCLDGTAPPARAPLVQSDTIDQDPDACFGKAIISMPSETTTEPALDLPALINSEVEFETPCDDVFTPQFISSVQRALQARDYYDGEINGTLDGQTTAAIERFQTDRDDAKTGQLTLRSARILGLVAIPRDQL